LPSTFPHNPAPLPNRPCLSHQPDSLSLSSHPFVFRPASPNPFFIRQSISYMRAGPFLPFLFSSSIPISFLLSIHCTRFSPHLHTVTFTFESSRYTTLPSYSIESQPLVFFFSRLLPIRSSFRPVVVVWTFFFFIRFLSARRALVNRAPFFRSGSCFGLDSCVLLAQIEGRSIFIEVSLSQMDDFVSMKEREREPRETVAKARREGRLALLCQRGSEE
jgi:hypothetical protein